MSLRSAATVALTCSFLMLAACSEGEPEGQSSTGTEPPAGAARSDDTQVQQAAYPVTVTHSLGETTIDAAPKRIVTLTDRDTDTVLALGGSLVGIRTLFGSTEPEFEDGVGPWADQLLGDAEPEVWVDRELNIEAIAATGPDLIVNANSDGDKRTHELLSQIAPTIALPEGQTPYGATLESTTTLVAQALGKTTEGEALLSDLDEAIAEQAAAHPEFATLTAGYFDMFPEGIWAYGAGHVVTDLLVDLGFELTDRTATVDSAEGYVEVSVENLADYAPSIMVVYPYGRDLAQLKAQIPTLSALPSVKQRRMLLLDDLSFSAASVLSINHGLQRLVPRLAEAAAH